MNQKITKVTLSLLLFIGVIMSHSTLLAFSERISAEVDVKGTVKDENGEPLYGAAVLELGTTNGTITDINGQYALTLQNDNASLKISFIGYKAMEVVVGSRNVVDVQLQLDAAQLEEIVVVGYGTQKKSDLTGAVVSASLEDFKEAPNTNIMQSLQGSVPGIQIGQTTSTGAQPSISIRGQTSINGNQSVLIILDGIIYRGRITDINPSEIESVDVLKDASSRAIYGSQAANGVIMITTKKGKANTPARINYSTSFATQNPVSPMRLLDREQSLQKVRDILYEDAYLAPGYTELNPNWDFDQSELLQPSLDGIANGSDYDWLEETTSPGHIINHNLSLSGGSENTTYFLSAGHTDHKGYILNDKYKRNALRLNIQTSLNDWLSVGANTYGSFTDYSGTSPSVTNLTKTTPFVVPRDENGELIVNHIGDNNINPFLTPTADDRETKSNISANLFAVVSIPWVQGLTYRLNYNNSLRWTLDAESNLYSAGLTGAAQKSNASVNDRLFDNILSYDRRFGDHGVNATFVVGYNKIDYEQTTARGENFANLDLSYNSLEQAVVQTIGSNAWNESATYQLARTGYNYQDKYLVTASVRRDGSSRFAKNNKFAVFPSASLGWVLSKEAFLNSDVISFLKLRTGYGKNGNLTDRYTSLARVSSDAGTGYVFGDGGSTAVGTSVSTLANPDLKWETTGELNIGTDFELFDGRVSGSADYYKATTKDLLWERLIPQITGFSRIQTNIGELSNTGLELILRGTPLQTEDLRWDVTFNYSTNSNKIVSLLGEDIDGDGVEDDLVSNGLFIGESIGTRYDYETDGIWQLDDDIMAGYFPGTYRIVDQNADGEISAAEDRKILGRSEAAFRFGIQNTVAYKNFTLRFFVNSIQGGSNGYLGYNHPTGISGTTGTAQNSNWFDTYDYWSPTNPNGKYPMVWTRAAINPRKLYSRSFVRLQDISLAYNLDQSLADKLGVTNLKVFVSGKNLLTLTSWDGWDPETNQGVGTNFGGGDNSFPLMKALSVGLDVSF